MNFIAIDVETANEDLASICQIGLVEYEGTSLIREWKTYVDPEDEFSGFNIGIHGIDESTISEAPNFPTLFDQLSQYLSNRIVCSHTSFDQTSIKQACAKYGLSEPSYKWLDTARVARRAWEQFAYGGYRLKNVCKFLDFTFLHHDALEDAKAAAWILLRAIETTGLDPEAWLQRVKQPIDPTAASSAKSIAQDGNPDGTLYGEVIAFTGALKTPRSMAAKRAAKAGCKVTSGVTKATTLLVVGDQDITKLAGHGKSSKHRKAEDLIQKGQQIRIICEKDFKILIET